MAENILKLGEILNFLIEESNLSEAALSRKIGIPRATVNRLISGRTPDPRASTLDAIAKHFNISIDQLLGKQPLLDESHQKIKVTDRKVIPVIDWKNALNWKNTGKSINSYNHLNWLTIDFSTHEEAFGLIFTGDSMWPQFQENTLLIVDPNKQFKNRDFVVAHIKKNDDILFRQIFVEGKCTILKAINPIFPSTTLEADDEILGTVIQTRNSYS